MMRKFSIVSRLDLEKLNNIIRNFKDQMSNENSCYEPIILMSPDTLRDMPNLPDEKCVGISTNNYCTGMIGKYYGSKVFSDPTLKYGEVELR